MCVFDVCDAFAGSGAGSMSLGKVPAGRHLFALMGFETVTWKERKCGSSLK